MNIRNLFVRDAIIRALTVLPVLKTPVMDTIFLQRPQSPLAMIGVEDILPVTNALPLVRRGAPSIPATQATPSVGFYEPLPVNVHVMVTAADLNNLRLLDQDGLTAWSQARMDYLRRGIRKTTEALCAQALTGKIEWPVQLDGGGWDTCVVDWGAPLSKTPGKTWDADGCAIADVFELLSDMQELIQDNGYGGTVEVWAGRTAYGALFALAEAFKSTAKIAVEITDQGINVGGYLVRRRSEKYRNPRTGAMVPVLADKSLLMIATDAEHRLPYCAVDDLDANLQALPFFVKPIKLDDPSGYRLVAQSKPFPVPNVRGICKSVVVS